MNTFFRRSTIMLACAGSLCAVVGGCDQRSPSGTTNPPTTGSTGTPTPTDSRTPAPAPTTDSRTPAPNQPDNTGVNRRDTGPGATPPTPTDQAENETDRRITADIRKAIIDDNLSVNADNCKIITKDGVVTLRGPVNSQAEKDAVEAKARAVAGVRNVTNELEIKTP